MGEWLDEVPAQVQELLTFAALDDRPGLELLGRLAARQPRPSSPRPRQRGCSRSGSPTGRCGSPPPRSAPNSWRGCRVTRALHARLAEASRDSVRRDRHTALAADADDPQSALHAARSAVRARQRGDHALAAELSFLAAQRTPHDDGDLLTERALTAVRDAAHYGDLPAPGPPPALS
ncbi:hypothetical protein ACFQ60_02465 [Streptomyces zhihengii]